jgi:hypothetical protein
MLRKSLLISLTLLLGAAATPAFATVYRWVDAKGFVHYSDRPPEGAAKVVAIDPRFADRNQSVQQTTEDTTAPADNSSPPPPDDSSPGEQTARENSVQQDVERARTEQCKKARERYQNYVQSQRLFKEDKDGKRTYLSDTELTDARLKAKRDVDELCKAQ